MRLNNDNFFQWIINYQCNCKDPVVISDWILQTGFWDDNGFWRDESIWID